MSGGTAAACHPNSIASTAGNIRRCLCEYVKPADDARLPWDFSVLCSACCKRSLRPHIERHEQALLERDLARERCAQRLARIQNAAEQQQGGGVVVENSSASSGNFSELQYESQRLRQRRAQLQKQCAAMAVEVAEHAYKNEERRESLNPQAELQRQQLQRLDQSVCEGSMKQAISNAREQVRILRFQWALKAFAMHRLDVRAEDTYHAGDNAVCEEESQEQRRRSSIRSKDGGRSKQARGIGKIGGLPLPHAGPELYGVLPPEQLQSALRLVASISSTVARCLGILLPHPVLLQRTSSYQHGDIIHSALMPTRSSSTQQKPSRPKDQNEEQDPTSTASLVALLTRPLDDSDSRNTTEIAGLEERANSTVVPPSMDPALVSQRLRHATAAVLAEAAANGSATASSSSSSTTSTSQYALSADIMHQDEFAIALQFLQNNVIALCIRAGVPVAKLWPAEAVLLNLYALQVFCEDQVKQILK